VSKKTLVAVVVVAVLLVPAVVLAQTCNFDLRYDPQCVSTISGTVLTTINYDPGNPLMGPQAVILSSGNQTQTVFLGPGWYLSQAGITFNPGDTITVTGSSRNIAGTNYFIASNVTTPRGTFAIRNAVGTPLWGSMMNLPIGAGSICPPMVSVPSPPTTIMSYPIGAGPVCPSTTCPSTTCPSTVCPPAVVVTPTAASTCATCPPYGAGPAIPGPLVPFNSFNIITISGTIERGYEQQTAEDVAPGLVLLIRQDDPNTRPQRVLLAPVGVMAQSGLDLSRGQHIVVQGSPVNIRDDYIVVATQVSQGCTVFSLRTCAGIPMWACTAPCPPCPTTIVTPPVGAGPCATCGPRTMNQVCPSSVPQVVQPVCPPVQPVCPPAQPVCPPTDIPSS
jgi:hypothetical protein